MIIIFFFAFCGCEIWRDLSLFNNVEFFLLHVYIKNTFLQTNNTDTKYIQKLSIAELLEQHCLKTLRRTVSLRICLLCSYGYSFLQKDRLQPETGPLLHVHGEQPFASFTFPYLQYILHRPLSPGQSEARGFRRGMWDSHLHMGHPFTWTKRAQFLLHRGGHLGAVDAYWITAQNNTTQIINFIAMVATFF